MPILKPIAGHTSTARIESYLEKNGRALARDFYNLSWDENQMAGYDEAMKDGVHWSQEMDELRASCGNDLPHGGRRARTFVHYVMSPTPEDSLNLEQLRELSRSWVQKYLPDYQTAIIYHDDNQNGIPHAHIVVNNTNVVTGLRIQIPNPFELNRGLQDMAEQRGFGYLRDEVDADDGFGKLASKGDEPATLGLSKQEYYLSRAERRVLESGEYSWVNDIRDRVSMAKNLARNESEFRQILDMLEVDVDDNSPKANRADWIYALRDQGARRVGGERLGYTFGKEALQSRFARSSAARPTIAASKNFMAIAVQATEINDLVELHNLAFTLELNGRYGIAGIDDYARRISSLESKREHAETPRQKDRITAQITQLEQAREFVREKALLPQQRPARPKRQLTPAQKKVAAQRSQSGYSYGDSRYIDRGYDQPSRDSRSR